MTIGKEAGREPADDATLAAGEQAETSAAQVQDEATPDDSQKPDAGDQESPRTESAAESAEQDDSEDPDRDDDGDVVDETHDDSDEDDESDGEIPEVYRRKLSKARREAARLRTRTKQAEAEAMRWRVGAQAQLKPALIKRLQGATEEEMIEDAQVLLEEMGQRRTTPPGLPTERAASRHGVVDERVLVDEETDVSKLGARIYDR